MKKTEVSSYNATTFAKYQEVRERNIKCKTLPKSSLISLADTIDVMYVGEHVL